MIQSIPLVGSTQFDTFYELAPLLPFTEWWHALLFGFVALILIAACVALYVLDSRGLRPGVALSLGLLRVVGLCLILLFFVQPEKKTQKSISKNHRVSVLIDTSSSMAGKDVDSASTQQASPLAKRRIDAAIDSLLKAPNNQTNPTESESESLAFVSRLRQNHDVNLYRFDEELKPEVVASLPSTKPKSTPKDLIAADSDAQLSEFRRARTWLAISAVLMLLGLSLVLGYAFRVQAVANPNTWSMLLLGGTVSVILALLFLGFANLTASNSTLSMLIGLSPFQAQVPNSLQSTPADAPSEDAENESVAQLSELELAALRNSFQPNGSQTRLGDALTEVIQRERGNPMAGIIVFTDGQSTQGRELSVPESTAIDAGIRLFPIGLGSPDRPQNVRIAELQAPQRVYPTDKFLLKGLIQATGFESQNISYELVATSESDPELVEAILSGEFELPADGQSLPFEFELDSEDIGKLVYELKLLAPEEDFEPRDNSRTVSVEVVQRRNRVLMIAGGPTREYRFLRDQLHRDKDTRLHVLLQTATSGIAQDADAILFEFPSTPDEWNEYDCIVAFDADWTMLTKEQARQLEDWVSKEAGGLIVVAGPVFTPVWTRRARGDEVVDRIRRLYPVSFFNQASATLRFGRFGGEDPFPLRFSREGRAASFLWLEDSAIDSQAAWDAFEGVFGYYAVNDSKSGALVLSEFSDPDTELDGKLPIYMASQFYGAGRVFFQASGEMWRLRTADVDFFEQYYTKLIHWVSQGRLLRDSQRGFLIADKNQVLLGDTITFQAILRDEQDRPLQLKQIDLSISQDQQPSQTLTLESNSDQKGSGVFSGRFSPTDIGAYTAELPIPGGELTETLTVEFNVEIPQYEQQQPERNDSALLKLAEETGGKYLTDLGALEARGVERSELEVLLQPNVDQVHRVYLPPTVDNRFRRCLVIWLLILITTVFCFEWLLRRTHRLA